MTFFIPEILQSQPSQLSKQGKYAHFDRNTILKLFFEIFWKTKYQLSVKRNHSQKNAFIIFLQQNLRTLKNRNCENNNHERTETCSEYFSQD